MIRATEPVANELAVIVQRGRLLGFIDQATRRSETPKGRFTWTLMMGS
jgi:hypothetical protein